MTFSSDVPLDSQRTVLKARPEEFIHIFVHKKRKLIQFLEHMIHVSTVLVPILVALS